MIPEPREESINGTPVEVALANINSRGENFARQYIKNNCDKNGFHRNQNLSQEEANGIKSLKQKLKNNEVYITNSDKTGQLVDRMQEHIVNDRPVDWEEKESKEKILNGHALQMGRWLQIGMNYNYPDRVKKALRNNNAHIPVMRGADKTHKEGFDEAVGPPLRGIVAADEAPNGQIASTMAEILQPLALEVDKVLDVMALSTEELMAAVAEVNKLDNTKEENQNLDLFSMDIEKMYPSADVDEVCRVAAEEWFNSELNLDVDVTERALYLAVVYDRDFLVNIGLGDVTHTRLKRNGPKPGITTPEILTRTSDTVSKFVPPRRFPNEDEKRMMTKLALEFLMMISLKSHMYSFNGEIRLQMRGGAIGDILTGAVMAVYVLYWARILKQKLAVLGIAILLFKIYIDDQNFVMKSLPPGSRIVDDRLVIIEEEIEADRLIPSDLRSARLVQSVANTISPFIKVTHN